MDPVAAESGLRAEAPRSWPVLVTCGAGLIAVVVLSVAHAARVEAFAGDDRLWVRSAEKGLLNAWTHASPYANFRPTFVSWLWLVLRAGLTSPGAFLLTTLLLNLILLLSFFWCLRPVLSRQRAMLSVALFFIHPMRQAHMFWMSDGTDVLALILTFLCIGITLRERGSSYRGGVALGFITIGVALACLAKETALLMPLLLFLLPGRTAWPRRLAAAVAAGAGCAVATAASTLVLGGLGRTSQALGWFQWTSAIVYPMRLVWPGDFESAVMAMRLEGGVLRGVCCGGLSALLLGGLLWELRWWDDAAIRLALLFLAAGLIVCIFRHEERSFALGGAGLGVLIACLRPGASGRRLLAPVVALIVLGLAWSPLWIDAERRWTEVTIVSRAVSQAVRGWRMHAVPTTRLVSLGVIVRIGEGTKAPWIREMDDFSLDLLSVEGPEPTLPVRIRRLPEGTLLETVGMSHLSWSCLPQPELGIAR